MLDPVAGVAVSLFRGRTYLGEELLPTLAERPLEPGEVKVGEWARESFAPLSVNDIWEAYEMERLRGGLIATPWATLGGTVSSYPSRTFDKWADWVATSTGKDWNNDSLYSVRQEFNDANKEWLEWDELEGSREKDEWRRIRPHTEAKMYFWGAVRELSTPEAVSYFKSMATTYKLPEDTFPVEIIKQVYDLKGKKPEENFTELLRIVPKYLADNMLTSKATWGDEEVSKLIPAWTAQETTDQKLIRQYRRDTLGQDARVRERYRKLNPELDAALNLQGDAQAVKSKQALVILAQRAVQLGIAPELIPALAGKRIPVGEQGTEKPLEYYKELLK